MSLRVTAALSAALATLLLTGCASHAPVSAPEAVATSAASTPEGEVAASVPVPATPVVPADPQVCLSSIDCTLKTARTLLFVYDYAALGAPLPERNGSLITTPSDADQGPWPAISIRLPVAQDSRFLFSSLCLSRQCRYTGSELQDIYRRYLAGDPCALPGDVRRNCKLKP